MSTRKTTRTVAQAAAPAKYVALIARISRDKTGRVEGVKGQLRWGHSYAEKTWPGLPIREYADNDVSAFDDTAVRPEFERFRDDLKAGLIAHAVAVEQSRLERREGPWFSLAAELAAGGVEHLHTKREGVIAVQDVLAGVLAVLNGYEVRKLKKRVNDRLDENARNGTPAGVRPYGYRHGLNAKRVKTLLIVESEAAVIKECADRVLAGWSLSSIADDLVARGVHGPYRVKVRDADGEIVTEDGTPVDEGGVPVTRASRIGRASVKSWLTSPTIAGLRVHRGEVIGDGNWEPILDRGAWQAVKAKLSGPRKVIRGDNGQEQDVPDREPQRFHRGARRYLLTSGTAVCGVCGAALIASEVKFYRPGGRVSQPMPQYRCPPTRGGGHGCVSVLAEPLEAYVVETLLAELDKPAVRRALAADVHAKRRSELLDAIDAIDGEVAELARMLGAKELTADEWRIAKAAAVTRQQQARAELVALPPPATKVDVTAIREGWSEMTPDEQREIVTMFIRSVAVNRASPGTKAFASARVAPPKTWWRDW